LKGLENDLEVVPSAAELYPWMAECNAFLKAHGQGIDSMDHPQIHVIDQFIKQVLEGLTNTKVPGMRALIETCDGSPLQALYKVAEYIQKELWNQNPRQADLLLGFIVARLEEDLALKKSFTMAFVGSSAKIRAAAQLRQRGLMK
jgi:hypothetical protein